MKFSIKHDITFQEALVVYADAQSRLFVSPSDESKTPIKDRMEAEQWANQATGLLCDCIDLYVDRFARGEAERLRELAAKAKAAARKAKQDKATKTA